MRPPIRTNGLALIAIPYAAALGALATIHPALTALACAPVLWVLLSDLAARHLSPHVVYQLHDDDHRVLYVGETNDVIRRMLEHTDGTEHDWYADIYGYTIARHCWSDRQAKRIERRRITVLNNCAEHAWCDRLRNEIYDDNHRRTGAILTVWTWKPLYLATSMVFDSCTFHTPCGLTRPIPQRPEPDDDLDVDEWAEADGPAVHEPHTATYERHQRTSHAPVTPLALPPVSCHSEPVTSPRDTTRPPTGDGHYPSGVTDSRDSRQEATIGAQVRDAHQRRQGTLTDPFSPDLACHLTADERDRIPLLDDEERTLLAARLRQRKSRANRRNGNATKPTAARRPDSGDAGSSNGHQTRPARGGGGGGGET